MKDRSDDTHAGDRGRNYTLRNYDPLWPERFVSIRAYLADVFERKTDTIEHVGSTSVPGLCAKPVIDVAILVDTMDEFAEEKTRMMAAGYLWRADYVAPDTLLFWHENEDGSKTENIHVCRKDSGTARQFLAIRDYLRAFPEKAKGYGSVKTESHRMHPDDYRSYRKAKAPFLARLEQEAYS